MPAQNPVPSPLIPSISYTDTAAASWVAAPALEDLRKESDITALELIAAFSPCSAASAAAWDTGAGCRTCCCWAATALAALPTA